MDKKQSNLSQLMGYAGRHRYLTYLSLILSAASAILALFPFVFLFRIIQEVIAAAPDYTQATHIVRNGWMAAGFAALSIVIYVCALMSSHLSAFRIAGNIRKALMAHIAELPLGFIGEMGTGKIRRVVNDSSAATETYLAHQLPDMAAAIATPVCMIVMLFLFDWRFGLVSLLPVALGFAAMFKMAGLSMAKDMKLYQNALADMNNEAVEYVRGIPVVKTFGQTVHSFKRFKGTIDSYYDFVMSYCKKCRPSMLSYTVLVNSAFAFLIVLALILTGGGPVAQPVLLNFIFYVIFTPIIATAMTRVMFMSENGMIVADAMSRIRSILDAEPLPEPRSGKIPADNNITLENVTFRYMGAAADALHDVTIRVGSGETVALVGPSGGGKTTVAGLISRFWDVGGGSIRIGGVNVKDIPKETLMDTVAYVFQDSRLLKTSILENVRLARPAASRQEVERALHGEDTMAIFLTGDTHGDFSRFRPDIFYEQAGLTKDDCTIICGDFGGIWDGSPEEQGQLDWLEQRPYTTLFVSGNHENYDLLAQYPVEEWHGGQVQRVRPSVIHLMRGQVYDIQGRKFFIMGGASSHDIQDGILEPDDPLFKKKCRRLNARGAMYRVNHQSWWAAELPSEEEYQTARANLGKHGWEVDYIITHCCPSSVQDELSSGFYQADALTDFLDEIAQRCRFRYQFFGHYHTNKVIREKFVLLYDQIIKLKL